MTRIHPTAVVDPGARLGEGVRIGPFCVVESDVELGEATVLESHCVILGGTRWGARGTIGSHAVVGGEAQHLARRGVAGRVHVGDDVVAREGVSIHRASVAGAVTRIGDRTYLMSQSHVGHDCVVGSDVVVVNHVLLGGHVEVGDRAFLGGGSAIHQFCRVGELAMIGGLAKVTQDCLPFAVVDGNPARAIGPNSVGLRRIGASSSTIAAIKRAFLVLATPGSEEDVRASLRASEVAEVRAMIAFAEHSTRGITRRRVGRARS